MDEKSQRKEDKELNGLNIKQILRYADPHSGQ